MLRAVVGSVQGDPSEKTGEREELAMTSGEIIFDPVEPEFMPTMVGLAGPAAVAARAAGVLVDASLNIDVVAEQLFASASLLESGSTSAQQT